MRGCRHASHDLLCTRGDTHHPQLEEGLDAVGSRSPLDGDGDATVVQLDVLAQQDGVEGRRYALLQHGAAECHAHRAAAAHADLRQQQSRSGFLHWQVTGEEVRQSFRGFPTSVATACCIPTAMLPFYQHVHGKCISRPAA